jgi:hypothetical protein
VSIAWLLPFDAGLECSVVSACRFAGGVYCRQRTLRLAPEAEAQADYPWSVPSMEHQLAGQQTGKKTAIYDPVSDDKAKHH